MLIYYVQISIPLLGSNVLQLLCAPQEVVCVGLWNDLSLIWLLDEVFVALLLRKSDSILLGLEVDVCALHHICR